jgi:hypothetical protein
MSIQCISMRQIYETRSFVREIFQVIRRETLCVSITAVTLVVLLCLFYEDYVFNQFN